MTTHTYALKAESAANKLASSISAIISSFNDGRNLSTSISRFHQDYKRFKASLDLFTRSVQGEKIS